LGDPRVVLCAAARHKAKELRARVLLGDDPQGDRVAARKAVVFGKHVEGYLASIAGKVRDTTLVVRRRYLTLHAKALHPIAPGAITRGDLVGLLTTIGRERGEVAANRCGTVLTGVFGWLMMSGVIDANPMIGIKRYAERSRERVLGDDELARVWAATSGTGSFDRCVRVLMLTACRRDEVGGMCWSEIEGDVFTLSPDRSKNRRPHEIWLHPLVIAQLPSRTSGRDRIFGLSDAGYVGWARAKERLDRRLDGMPDWTLHDLRRTCATWLSEHDVEPHVVDAVLNHVSGSAKKGVAGVYNRAAYRIQKRAALALWAEHIAALTGQSMANVVPLVQLA
jgi:integrase